MEKTLRDEYAMAALVGMISSAMDHHNGFGDEKRYATLAYLYADAMLAEREKKS